MQVVLLILQQPMFLIRLTYGQDQDGFGWKNSLRAKDSDRVQSVFSIFEGIFILMQIFNCQTGCTTLAWMRIEISSMWFIFEMTFYSYQRRTIWIGATSINPSYDDTKNTAFTINTILTIIILMGTMISGLVIGIPLIIETGILLRILICSIPMSIVGLATSTIGTIRMYLKDGWKKIAIMRTWGFSALAELMLLISNLRF